MADESDAASSMTDTANGMSDFEMSVFIQNQRTYDVLMALLTNTAPDVARDLLEMHSAGAFMGPAPRFSGNFVADEIKGEESA